MSNNFSPRKANYRVALVGDSVLDNFYWLEDPTQDVRAQLEGILPGPRNRVVNLAVDESQIRDVLHGISPRSHYRDARRTIFKGKYEYPTASDGKVYPLALINVTEPTHIVLSVGGNDGRIHLNRLVDGAEALVRSVLGSGFVENYRALLDCLTTRRVLTQKTLPRVILVFVYKPHSTIFDWYKEQLLGECWSWLPIEGLLGLRKKLDEAYRQIRVIMLEIAAEYRLPVIDLSRTFDPQNAEHYGSSPIEPSNLSGKTIARLIKHVIEIETEARTKDNNRCSHIYWAPKCGDHVYSAPNNQSYHNNRNE